MNRRALTLIPLLFLVLWLPLSTQGKQNNSEAATPAATFDEQDAAKVLGVLRNGLESYSPRLFLSAFDAEKMNSYLTFRDQVEAYFTQYQSFRVSYHILQTSQENNHGVILADFEIENETRGADRVSRRQAQLRFELERGPKGWKIVDMDPRGFFF